MNKQRINPYKIIFLISVISAILFFSCENDGNILIPPPVYDYSPMWSQPCYNGRFTSNPKSPSISLVCPVYNLPLFLLLKIYT
jgi:hypothetical protein